MLFRGSLSYGRFTLMGDVHAVRLFGERFQTGFNFGGYFKAWRWLKVGYFYERQNQMRYDSDWVKGDDGLWSWTDASSRYDGLSTIDVTPQTELPWLPGTAWTGELKMRWTTNLQNQQQTIRLRPGLSYFWHKSNRPFLRAIAQYEMYFPRNYGVASLYEQWFYQGLFFLLSPQFELGATVAEKSVIWGSTPAFEAATGSSYKVKSNSIEVMLTSHFRLEY